jgi:hypothetical protein
MGLIADLDFPHVVVRARGQVSRVPPRYRCGTTASRQLRVENAAPQISGIMRDTPLVPRAAAEQVLDEASRLVHKHLPRDWAEMLAQRAEATYENGIRFRRRIQSLGDEGREWLWAFMRHWLAALILKERPDLFRKLPIGYAAGGQRGDCVSEWACPGLSFPAWCGCGESGIP